MLLKFWISNISNFFEKKKTVVLHNFLIKSRIHTIKQHKKFTIFFENRRQVKQKKKDVKNTNKLKKQIVNDEILKMFSI